MKILCIDQGLANIGVSIIDQNLKIYYLETYITTPKSELRERYKLIFDYFNKLIKKYKIDIIVYEHPVLNNKIGHELSGVVAITLLCSIINKVKIYGYAACTVKKVCTDNGKASKSDIENKMKQLYTIKSPKLSDHVYDSLAVGYTHLKQNAQI